MQSKLMQSKSLSRRGFLQLSAMTAAGATLAACAPAAPGGEAGAPAQDNTLRFWMWNTFAPAADEVLQEQVLAWGEENGVTIEISRDSDSNQQTKVMPALEAGTLPDVMVTDSNTSELMRNSNGTAEVTDAFNDIGAAHGGWQTNTEEFVTKDGSVFYMPYSIDTPMLMFRQDWMEEAGIAVPEGQWTWDQTRDIAAQMEEWTAAQGDAKIGWGFGVNSNQHDAWCTDLFRNMAADIWDESGERIILADEKAEEATRALNFAKEAWDMGLFPDDAAAWDTSSNNKFFQEDQGFLVINAASIYVWAGDNRPELQEAMGLSPKPADVRDTTDAGLRYLTVLTSQAQNQELATDFLKALYEPDVYAPWLDAGFVANVLKEYDELEMWTGKRAAFNLAAQIGVYGGYPAEQTNAAMAELNSSPNAPVGTMMVRVLVDGWTPEEAIAESDTFAKRVFEKYFG